MAQGENTTKKRKISVGKYKSFTLQKPISSGRPDLPSAFRIFRDSVVSIRRNWKPLGGIALWYGIISLALIQTVNSNDVANAKNAFSGMFGGTLGDVGAGAGSFLYLLGLSGNVTSTTGAYQMLLVIVCSLAFIWALRHAYAGNKVRVRDAFYEGMYPLIPFTVVLLVIALQLTPAIVGSALFTTVMNNGITAGPAEVIAWSTLFFLLVVLSLYLIPSSLFALYAVCLPHMTPMRALRSVRSIVMHRRWLILRKILFLPLILLVISGVILIPFIMLLPAAVAWLFYLFMVICVVVVHSYLYTLYRLLLRE